MLIGCQKRMLMEKNKSMTSLKNVKEKCLRKKVTAQNT